MILTCLFKKISASLRSLPLVSSERVVHMKYESSTSNGSKVMTKVKVFRNVGQRSQVRSQGHPSTLLSFERSSMRSLPGRSNLLA